MLHNHVFIMHICIILYLYIQIIYTPPSDKKNDFLARPWMRFLIYVMVCSEKRVWDESLDVILPYCHAGTHGCGHLRAAGYLFAVSTCVFRAMGLNMTTQTWGCRTSYCDVVVIYNVSDGGVTVLLMFTLLFSVMLHFS